MGFTRDEALIKQFLAAVQQMLRPLPYKQWQVVTDNDELCVRVRLQRAGHILGSSYIEIETLYKKHRQRHVSVYSGDLGAPYAPLLPAPKAPYGCDTLIIESTYGNRVHENRRERRARLREVITHALLDKGTVMIPAFSIGRTQEILYELEELIHQSRSGKWHNPAVDWSQLQVIVDSPLASRFNEVYRELRPYWDAEAQQRIRAGRHPLSFDNLITIDSHEDHQKTVAFLARTGQPAVVIAASGMAAGGRIVNYLKAMLHDPVHCVLFVGYQARGTPGHRLQQIAADSHKPGHRPARVRLDGEDIEVRALIRSIGGYSAHADQKDLLNFVKRMRRRPSHIRIIHGERRARESLREQYRQLLGESVRIELPEKAKP